MEELVMSKMTLEIFTTLEQKWLSAYTTPTPSPTSITSKKTKLLTIDGGGAEPTSTFITGTSLIHLEHQIQLKTNDPHARIPDYFDLIAGTGTGAIYAVLITAADNTGRPLFSATEAVTFLTQNHTRLFHPNKRRHFPFNHGRSSTKFSNKSLETLLKSTLTLPPDVNGIRKILTLKDTCKPLLIPCFDLTSHAPFVFSRAGALESPNFDFELWKVLRATTATPSYFTPFELSSVNGVTTCRGIDGGLTMNNPAAAAVTHVIHNKFDFPNVNGVEDLLVLSLGNGIGKRGGGNECSTADVVGIVVDGVSDTVDQMLGNAFCWNRADYVRIQSNGGEEVMKERGVETLTFGGKRLLTETNGDRIEKFVQRIVAGSGRCSLPASPLKAVSPLVHGR